MLLAIDASTKSTGVAIFGEDKALLGSSVITASSPDLINRIHKIVDKIDQLIGELNITDITMEEVLPDHQKNVKTFKALMYLQATIVIMCHDKYPQVKVDLVYPGSWRSVCGIKTGRGVVRETLKKADIEFANQTYGLKLTSDDEADAVCIGHAFLHPKKDNSTLTWHM